MTDVFLDIDGQPDENLLILSERLVAGVLNGKKKLISMIILVEVKYEARCG